MDGHYLTRVAGDPMNRGQDVNRMCNYCGEEVSTGEDIKWSCKHFDPVRKEVDAGLAGIQTRTCPTALKTGLHRPYKLTAPRHIGELL